MGPGGVLSLQFNLDIAPLAGAISARYRERRMRRALLTLMLLACAGQARAADVFDREHDVVDHGDDSLPLRGSIHRDWDGFYVGLNVGWHGARNSETDQTALGVSTGFDRVINLSGAGIGVHTGYMWDTNRVVYGLEADAQTTFVGGSISSGALGRTDISSNLEGSVRGRLGYEFGNLMVYGTAGVAVQSTNYKDQSPLGSESYSRVYPGWTVGIGAEWAFTTHWAAGLEYRYTDFGTTKLRSVVAFPGYVENHATSEQTVRLGLTYRFTGY